MLESVSLGEEQRGKRAHRLGGQCGGHRNSRTSEPVVNGGGARVMRARSHATPPSYQARNLIRTAYRQISPESPRRGRPLAAWRQGKARSPPQKDWSSRNRSEHLRMVEFCRTEIISVMPRVL